MNNTVSHIEKQWVKELGEGNETSFRTIYDTYQRQVYSVAFYLTKSPDIAEEITQETFIRLWEKCSQINADTHLSAFLKKVTHNLVMDIYRKANRDWSLQYPF